MKKLAAPATPDPDHAALERIVNSLCSEKSLESVWHRTAQQASMPSLEALTELMDRLRAAIFPGFFGPPSLRLASLHHHLAVNLETVYPMLAEQIRCGGCFACDGEARRCQECTDAAGQKALAFLEQLPELRRMLASDAQAAYEGDPAAKSPGETIFCYPSMHAMIHQRIAHCLLKLEVPLIPRIITEMAPSRPGIDIHPGARIGEEFFIDHGTGVVIGETCVIGRCCRLYQGVTLGALSFPKDEQGKPIKGIPRHPILEDNVTVYAGATILGRVTVGKGAVIGGNVWLTHNVAPGAHVVQQRSLSPAGSERLLGNGKKA
ncbi:MAG: serine acetyltransferase [Deltaproteobacteria bacterium]|jgi:serine O-acetyltransferase|nr:serine acetyltransferase [Deltaproteobacteria bacterium]